MATTETRNFWGKELNITEREYNYINTTFGIIVRILKDMHTDPDRNDKLNEYRLRAQDVEAQLYGMLMLLEVQGKADFESIDYIMKQIKRTVNEIFRKVEMEGEAV